MISDIIDTRNIGILSLAWNNFNPSMDKKYSLKCRYKITYPLQISTVAPLMVGNR